MGLLYENLTENQSNVTCALNVSGSHTGHIQALGGSGDRKSARGGGGGGGGRISLTHSRHDSVPHYRGTFDVWGGAPGTNAEAGASGTVYVRDHMRDYSYVFFLLFHKATEYL